MSYHEAEELASAYPKSIFFRVEVHVIFVEFTKDFFRVHHMLGYALRLDDHVVRIYLNVSSDLLFKDLVHQSLVCSACIFKAEGHDLVVEIGIFNDECRFLLF